MNAPISREELRGVWSALTQEERTEVMGLLTKLAGIWTPVLGPQSEAYYSEADILGYGGAAGGGKTDLVCGLALSGHKKSVIYRREAAQLTGIHDRLEELLGSRLGFSRQSGEWRVRKGHKIDFGGFPNPGDERRHQGKPHDFVAFDEATEMLESVVRFLLTWLRSSDPKQRTRSILTFNPPTSPEGRWVIKFFGPWLDKRHPLYPTPPGVLRWCTTIDGEDVWVDDARPFVLEGATLQDPKGSGRRIYDFNPADYRGPRQALIIKPLSRTFIPAKVTDNPFYMRSGYLAMLQGLPEPLRSQMLNGDFEAGMKDDDWQVIPTAWVRGSMDRWLAMGSASPGFVPPGPMDSMGVDVAMGGKDRFVISRRHAQWFADLKRIKGVDVRNGAVGAGHVIQHRRNGAPVHVDVVGWGADTLGALVSNGVQALGVNGATKSFKRSQQGQPFANKRAELIWMLREALDPAGPYPVALPDDLLLEQDLTAYRWTPTRGGIQIEGKEEMKKRLGRSPDDGDAVCLALEETVKEEVAIDAIQKMGHGAADGDYDRMSF